MNVKNRGFASMDPEKRKEISARGGNATVAKYGTTAMAAWGRIGGDFNMMTHGAERMREIGKLGGEARARNMAARRAEAENE